jgi:hypothetical protein
MNLEESLNRGRERMQAGEKIEISDESDRGVFNVV